MNIAIIISIFVFFNGGLIITQSRHIVKKFPELKVSVLILAAFSILWFLGFGYHYYNAISFFFEYSDSISASASSNQRYGCGEFSVMLKDTKILENCFERLMLVYETYCGLAYTLICILPPCTFLPIYFRFQEEKLAAVKVDAVDGLIK